MADRVLPFDEIVPGDVSLQIDSTQALRITAIGTDSGTPITPSVNGDKLGSVVTEVGDTAVTGTSEQGLLTLGTPPGAMDQPMIEDSPAHGAYGPNLYYYVPPDARLSLDGASGDNVRLQGHRLDGVSGRFEGSADETRFREQGSYHYTFEEGTTTIQETFADGGTATVHTISPATDERIELVGPQMIAETTGSLDADPGDVGVFYDLEGQRYPGQFADDELFLVDFEVMPRPADDSTEQVPFVYGKYGPSMSPLTVQGDQDLDIKVRNTSGGALGTNAETTDVTYTAEVVFDERR
jgi:hypothetical protein